MSRIIDTQALPISLEITSSSTGPSNWYGNISRTDGNTVLVSYLNNISPGDTIEYLDQDTIVVASVNATTIVSSTSFSTTVNVVLSDMGTEMGKFTTLCKEGQVPMTFLGTLSEADGNVMYINIIHGSIGAGDTLNYNDGITTGTLTVNSTIDPDPPSSGLYTALVGVRGTTILQEVGCVFWKTPLPGTKRVSVSKNIAKTLLRK
jgi:hypothetical protein